MATRLQQCYTEEIRAVIRFLNDGNTSAAEIHLQLVEVSENEVMRSQSVLTCCSDFDTVQVLTNDWRELITYDSKHAGQQETC